MSKGKIHVPTAFELAMDVIQSEYDAIRSRVDLEYSRLMAPIEVEYQKVKAAHEAERRALLAPAGEEHERKRREALAKYHPEWLPQTEEVSA